MVLSFLNDRDDWMQTEHSDIHRTTSTTTQTNSSCLN